MKNNTNPTLRQVASEFLGINYNDLTTLEKNVYRVLADEGYLELKDGEVVRPLTVSTALTTAGA